MLKKGEDFLSSRDLYLIRMHTVNQYSNIASIGDVGTVDRTERLWRRDSKNISHLPTVQDKNC